MKTSRVVQATALAVACIWLMASVCAAQVSTSTISGTVVDKEGLLVVGAKVVVTNEGTGVAHETATTSAGSYTVSALPPGQYTVSVTHPGFRTFTSVHNVLTVGVPLVVDAQLQLGQVTEVVQVESTYARVETSNAMVSDVVNRRAVAELPLNGRNPLNLVVLQPGLVQRTNGAAGSGTHVFGSRDRAHNLTIDGIDANESSVPNPQSNIFRLTSDNVQEYRVVTHNATADFGRNSGANVTIATRAGTNEIHGDVYWYHRNTILNANESFNKSTPGGALARPVLLLHQYGADVGGPIFKNKTFFFGSWQNNRISMTQPISVSFGVPRVYTDALKNTGIFRYFVADPNNPFIIDGVRITRNSPLLVDPATGALRPGVPLCSPSVTMNCVATYNIFAGDPLGIGADATMRAMFAKFPSPNTYSIGDGLNFAGYTWNPPSRFTGPFYLGKVDHKFNDNNNLSGSFLWTKYDTGLGDFLNGRPSVFPGFPPLGEVFRTSQLLSVSYRRTFSPRLVNEAIAGFARFNFTFSLRESNAVGGVVPPPYGQQCFGGASLRNVDTPYCNTPHTQRAVSNIQFIDNLSYIRQAHNFRFGTNIRMYRHNDERGAPGGFNMSPTIIFDESLRPPAGFPSAGGIDGQDGISLRNAILELIGIPSMVQQAFVADPRANKYIADLSVLGTRAKQFNLYAQDEWKVRRNLTMTYGVRWEYNRPPRDCCGRVFVPNWKVDGSEGRVTYVPADSWWKRNNANALAPRVSIAWDPWSNGKTVVRAGYGIAFDTLSTFQVTAVGGKVPGISLLQCRVTPGAPIGSDGCGIVPDLRVTALLGATNPFALANPTVAPSANTSPDPRPANAAPNVGAFDPNLQMPTVHEWSFTVQRELPWNFVVQAGYIGKRGTHLFRAYDLNQIRIPPEFFQDFLSAQNNLFICRNNAATCLAAQAAAGIPPGSRTTTNFANFGLPGQVNLAAIGRLLGNPAVTSALWRGSNATDVSRNGLADLASRIDLRVITPANYFRPNPQFNQIFYFDSGGDSNYHGMILQLRRRFEKGLDLGFAYTLSKSMDNMSVDPVGASSGGALSATNPRTPTDVRNFNLDRGRSDFDDRHVIVLNALYELPFGRGRRWGSSWPGVLNHVLGGWTTTGIYIRQSGEPLSLNSGVRTVHNTKQSRPVVRGPMPEFSLQDVPGVQGPMFIRTGGLITNQNDQNFNCRQVIDTQSFLCIPGPGESGMGRNTIQGPGYWNFDLGILKNFTITERIRLQFRSEFFNVFNHVNYENPRNASSGSPTLTSSVFGQTCCSSASVPSSSTIIATGEASRVIQFALKIIF